MPAQGPGDGPARPKPKRRVRARPKQQPSSTARQNAAFGSRPARPLPKPKPAPKARPPRFRGTPTPDQAQGRPTEPVKVVIRKRHGAKVKREVHTLPNVAAAQAHLDRLEAAKKRRAELRGESGDTKRSPHPKVIVIPKAGETFEQAQRKAGAEQRKYDARVEAADRVTRSRVRREMEDQRRRDDRDIGLVGTARSGGKGRDRFRRAVEREARKAAPGVVHEARNLSAGEREQFHGEAVKAKGNQDAKDALAREARKREKARKAARGDAGDVVGNAKREVVDTLVGMPASVAELAKVGAEQLDTSGRVDKPHTKAFVKALRGTAAGHAVHGEFKEAGRELAKAPVSTVLTVVGGTGTAAKGAEVAKLAAAAAKAGKAGRAGRSVRAVVREGQAAKRVRENLTVDTKRRTTTKAQTRRDRAELQAGERKHRTGEVATKARFYSANPIIRKVQTTREDVRAARGHDPHQARGRKGKRVVKRDAGRRVDIVQAAGHVRQHEVDAAVDDALARKSGAKGAAERVRVRRREKRALRKGGKGTGRHIFAAVQSGIVKDAETLKRHIRVHEDALRTGEVDGEKLTSSERKAVEANLRRLRDADTRGLAEDADVRAAASQRVRVGEGQERRREPRLRGGTARMKARVEKAIREGRGAPLRKEAPDAPVRPSPRAADSGQGPGGEPKSMRFKTPSHELEDGLRAIHYTIGQLDDDLGNLHLRRKEALRRARNNADRKAILDKYEKARYAITQKQERLRGKASTLEQRLRTRHERLQAEGAVERTVHGVRVKHAPGSPEAEELRHLAREHQKVHESKALGARVASHQAERDRIMAAYHRDKAGSAEAADLRAAYAKEHGVQLPQGAHSLRRERDRLSSLAAEKPNRILAARIRKIERIIKVEHAHHNLQIRRKRRAGHREREIADIEKRFDLELLKGESHDARLAQIEARQNELRHQKAQDTVTPPQKETLSVRGMQQRAAAREVADELSGQSMHGDRARPTRDVAGDRAALFERDADGKLVNPAAARAALREGGRQTAPGGSGPTPPRSTAGTAAPEPDRGGYVPTTRELHGKPDSRLGVTQIKGRWSKKDLLTEDWSKYDPAQVQGRLERGISAAELHAEVLKSARGRKDLTGDQADAEVARLNAGSGVKWAKVEQRSPAQIGRDLIAHYGGEKEALKATHPDRGGDPEEFDAVRAAQKAKDFEPQYAVVPKAVADRFLAATKQHGLFGRSVRNVNARFVRAVLPLSATWHLGNAVDMMTRLALTGARPGDAALARELRGHLADSNEEWARLALDSVGGAHFRGQSTREATIRHIPILDDALDQLFAAGRSLEAKAARSAQGAALRQQAKALGQEAHDVQTMVKEWQRRPELVEDFQRRTLEIIGDYVHHPLLGSKDLRTVAPFIQWIKASLKFTFGTLPAKHPIRTALLFNLAAMTDKQRQVIGASSRITDEQAKALGFPKPMSGYLSGGLDIGGGIMPTANLSSFGAAAGLLDDPLQWASGILVPWAAGPAGRALASRDSATEYAGRTVVRAVKGEKKPLAPGAGRDAGNPGSARALAEAGSSLAESLVPGLKQAGQVARKGRRPGVHTTAVTSLRGGRTADGKNRDGSTGRSYGPVRVLTGTAVQKDFPSKPSLKTRANGTIVTVKALDGSTYEFDTRTGTVIEK